VKAARRNRPAWRRSAVLLTGLSIWLAPFAIASADEEEPLFYFFQVEEFEYRANDNQDTFNWDAQGWIGGDFNKLWLKTEGEQPIEGRLEEAEIQALYSRKISDFFDAQVGIRYDFAPDPERTFAVVGIEGLAPYFFEIDAAAFVSNKGEISGRFKAEYDILLTQKLVLQPKFEMNVAVQEVEERGIGSGVNDVELGLRLRYEIVREFAPYVGVDWTRDLGQTADFSRAEGEDVNTLSFVAGVRFWF
jgi:copper resistance protein B